MGFFDQLKRFVDDRTEQFTRDLKSRLRRMSDDELRRAYHNASSYEAKLLVKEVARERGLYL